MKKRESKLLPWLGFLLLFIACVYIVFGVSARRSLRDATEQLRTEGRPVALEELVPEEVPAEENAAPVYEEVVTEFNGEEDAEGSTRLDQLAAAARACLADDADAVALAKFRELYESGGFEEALALLEEASRKGYWSELDYSEGINLAMPHIPKLMHLSQVLAATSKMQAAGGDHAAALETAMTALRMAQSLESEPLLISQLVRAAMFQNAVGALQGIDFSSAEIPYSRDTMDLLRSFEDPAPFVAATDMERVIMSEMAFDYGWSEIDAYSEEMGIGGQIMLGAYKLIPPLRHNDQAAHTRIMMEYARYLEKPYIPNDPDADIVYRVPPSAFMTKMMTPHMGGFKERIVALSAESRVTQAGLALLEHRQRTGSFPLDLSAVAASNTTDPFTGEPLRYEPAANGFTLYSVGRDHADDRGVPSEKRGPGDIVWQYVDGE